MNTSVFRVLCFSSTTIVINLVVFNTSNNISFYDFTIDIRNSVQTLISQIFRSINQVETKSRIDHKSPKQQIQATALPLSGVFNGTWFRFIAVSVLVLIRRIKRFEMNNDYWHCLIRVNGSRYLNNWWILCRLLTFKKYCITVYLRQYYVNLSIWMKLC